MSSSQALPVIAVVDDDNVYQFTATRTIQATQLANQILQFQNGQEALDYLSCHLKELDILPDIIFLDINMPITDGWMFLDEFNKLKADLGKDILIYMVSSSIDPRDLNRARSNPMVSDYVEKPISLNRFAELLRGKS